MVRVGNGEVVLTYKAVTGVLCVVIASLVGVYFAWAQDLVTESELQDTVRIQLELKQAEILNEMGDEFDVSFKVWTGDQAEQQRVSDQRRDTALTALAEEQKDIIFMLGKVMGRLQIPLPVLPDSTNRNTEGGR
ncbi:hypothetical protein LCGC14_0412240 [marine sediment metagenome]|uniref:Uncharacterized protein n=1 Tax=marine sediment metagenome TaxID=412755 RepID=A0A0F9W2L0_9ZZZZ